MLGGMVAVEDSEGYAVEGFVLHGDHIDILCKCTSVLNFGGVPITSVVHFNKRITTVDSLTAKKVTEAMQALLKYVKAQEGQ